MARSCVILLLNGVADGPVGITLDILGAAARVLSAGLAGKRRTRPMLVPRVVSLDGKPVISAAGRTLTVDGRFSLRGLRRGDCVVFPGMGLATREDIDAAFMRRDVSQAARLIAKVVARGATVAASCSATFVVGASGALDHGEATTTWWLTREFSQRFPNVTLRADRMVVTSGAILTAGSAFAHADLVLSLLARAGGPTLAQLVSRYLVIDERPSQARYMIADHLRTDDPSLRKLERFVLAHLDQMLTTSDLALAAGTSPRTLARRMSTALGTTPQRFVQRMKVERAVHLLETTDDSVDAIAAHVGYADPAAFRRVLRREVGRSPRELRRRSA